MQWFRRKASTLEFLKLITIVDLRGDQATQKFACSGCPDTKTATRCLPGRLGPGIRIATGRPFDSIAIDLEPGRDQRHHTKSHAPTVRQVVRSRMSTIGASLAAISQARRHLSIRPYPFSNSARTEYSNHYHLFHAEPGLLEISGCHPGPPWRSLPRMIGGSQRSL